MSSPYAEGGPLPPVDREKIAEHERRISEWEEELDDRLARALRAYAGGQLHTDGRPIP